MKNEHVQIVIAGEGRSTVDDNDRPSPPNEREQFYDDEIAPLLRRVGELCLQKQMPFVSVVEFDTGGDPDIGRTHLYVPGQSLTMTMLHHLAKHAPNIDAFVMGIARYCKDKDISTTDSIVMQKLFP